MKLSLFKFKKLIHLIPFLFYIIISLIAFRGFLSFESIIGHNWDHNLTGLSCNIDNILNKGIHLWDDTGLGFANMWQLSSKIWLLLWSLAGKVIGAKLYILYMLILTLTFLGSTIYFYSFYFLSNCSLRTSTIYFSSILGGLFFMFSPVVLGHIIGGAYTQLVSLIPLILLLISIEWGRKSFNYSKAILLCSICMAFISISWQQFVFSTIFLIGYIIILFNINIKFKIYYIFLFLISTFFTNFYWMLPTICSIRYDNVTSKLQKALYVSNLVHNVPSILDAFHASGYFVPFFKTVEKQIYDYHICSFTAILFVIIICSTFILVPRYYSKLHKSIIYWLFLFLFFLIFATGFNAPAGPLVKILYDKISFMSLFRSPQWFMGPLTVCFSLLLSITISILIDKLKLKKTKILFLIIILFIVSPTYITGDFGTSIIYNSRINDNHWYNGDHLDSYNIPYDYKKSLEIIAETEEAVRVLPLPMEGAPYYLSKSYQRQGSGKDPELLMGPKAVLASDITRDYRTRKILSYLERLIYNQYSDKFIHWLKYVNAGFIILKKDRIPNAPPNLNTWDYTRVNKLIERNKNIIARTIVNGKSTKLLKLSPSITLPRIYATKSIICNSLDVDSELDFMDYNQHHQFSYIELGKNISYNDWPKLNQNSLPIIDFQKINSSKYHVKIQNLKSNFLLIFQEQYHPMWKVKINDKYILPEKYHFRANVYANAWLINESLIKKNLIGKSLSSTANGKSCEIIIEFVLQKYVTVGIYISIITIVLLLFFIITHKFLKRPKLKK